MIIPGDHIVERLEYLIERAKYYGELTEALPVFEELHRKVTTTKDLRGDSLNQQYREEQRERAKQAEPV